MSRSVDRSRALELLHSAELVCDEATVRSAVDRLAREITATLADEMPLVLSVMSGAVVFAGQLLPRLSFPLECDYLHATRYDGRTRGGALHWEVEPRQAIAGRVVLVLDDILDEGHTLAAIKQRLLDQGAARVYCAVFADKATGRPKPIVPDFVGVQLPDRYVFGFGMDVEEAWRNLPAIYALKQP